MQSPNIWIPSVLTVAIVYISVGVAFIFLHGICAYLILSDHEMRKPTYQFMVNLSVTDSIELAVIAVFNGVVAITNLKSSNGFRFALFLLTASWYASVVLLVFMAFQSMDSPNKAARY